MNEVYSTQMRERERWREREVERGGEREVKREREREMERERWREREVEGERGGWGGNEYSPGTYGTIMVW